MKAVGYRKAGAADAPGGLEDFEQARPEPKGHDLLVKVHAVSVNPVDTKVRRRDDPAGGVRKVLGWDAAGIVESTGENVSLFKPGDEVFYAGSIDRPGSNSEFHLADERIVGPKPASLNFAEAAAMPLTAITAWEALFDRLDVRKPVPGAAPAIVIVGGAGGVGSIAIQLIRALTDLRVIATASRPETREWTKAMGAHHVIDHRKPIDAEVKALGLGQPAFVFSTTETDKHFDAIVELLSPQGRFCLIDDPPEIDVRKLKRKSLSLHWELMFTRPLFGTADMAEQNRLLTQVSRMVDDGRIRTTLAAHYGKIDAANLRRAHALIESGKSRGKIVLEGF